MRGTRRLLHQVKSNFTSVVSLAMGGRLGRLRCGILPS
ncbi:hypothetical protein N7448_002794 [Penicillium atrosanguineum]|nr:hypothetical protein N7448_002794 [Penicillium atrosanguineum]